MQRDDVLTSCSVLPLPVLPCLPPSPASQGTHVASGGTGIIKAGIQKDEEAFCFFLSKQVPKALLGDMFWMPEILIYMKKAYGKGGPRGHLERRERMARIHLFLGHLCWETCGEQCRVTPEPGGHLWEASSSRWEAGLPVLCLHHTGSPRLL